MLFSLLPIEILYAYMELYAILIKNPNPQDSIITQYKCCCEEYNRRKNKKKE